VRGRFWRWSDASGLRQNAIEHPMSYGPRDHPAAFARCLSSRIWLSPDTKEKSDADVIAAIAACCDSAFQPNFRKLAKMRQACPRALRFPRLSQQFSGADRGGVKPARGPACCVIPFGSDFTDTSSA